MTKKKNIVVGISGASGVIYAIRLLKALEHLAQVQLVISDVATSILKHEMACDLKKESLIDYMKRTYSLEHFNLDVDVHASTNFYAPISSGSYLTDGMVILPCSMKTLSGVANGSSGNLIERAADVTLKESRKLILVTRETPLNRVHLQNMLRAHDAGATILPATPAFYLGQKSQDEMVDFVVARVLNQFQIEHNLVLPWGKTND
jgi:4-hydroxy-3-polyprenylbenzoate decarboxylase